MHMTMRNETGLPEHLIELAQRNFTLLKPDNGARQNDIVHLTLSGYGNLINLVADIIKVSILALGNNEEIDTGFIPNAEIHVSGVLALVLDLLPYDEADLLDEIRRSLPLQTAADPLDMHETDEANDSFYSFFNIPPSTLWEDSEDYRFHKLDC